MSKKIKLNEYLIENNYFESINEANRHILAGEIIVDNHRVSQCGAQISFDANVRLKNTKEFVSRGAYKLLGALKEFHENVNDKKCADLGCSTGGFTQCLLQAGAKSVSAIDVGYGQFDYGLRRNSKVMLFERTNIRNVDIKDINGPFDLVVGDLSFISLCSIIPKLYQFLDFKAHAILLIKPQFELDTQYIDKGGIVTNFDYHVDAIKKVLYCTQKNNLSVLGLTKSSIKGAKGNIEYFVYLRKPNISFFIESVQKISFNEKQIRDIVLCNNDQ